ncbi:MAG: HAMP domain-containing histidine kinase [bacterium]|nr:HAMP domain-containing histidine kinase [bacterium]
MTRGERLLARIARERKRGHEVSLLVVEARTAERAALLPVLREGDRVERGSTPQRLLIGAFGLPRSAPPSRVDLRVVAARVELALSARAAAAEPPRVGWLDPRATLPTDLREAEERALLMARLERERRALFTAVGHELRTPLTSARGYLEVLLSDPPRRRTDVRRFLEIAQRETLRAARLVDGLFELSLLETGFTALRPSAADLAPIARAAVESLALEARRNGVRVRRRIRRADAPLDAERAMQAVLNIVHNAIKFARGGVWLESRRIAGSAVLTVDDDGPGFDEEDLRAVSAFGVRGSAGRGACGSGVGLALAEAVAVSHGGSLVLERSPQGGARVRLLLPAGQRPRRDVLTGHGRPASVRAPE